MKPAWVLLVVLGTAFPALAQDRWDRNKGDCETVFRSWRTESIDRLRECVMQWEMYRDVTKVNTDDRSLAQEAFDKLYMEGTERDAVMSLSALKKLGLRPTRLREKTKAVPVAAPPVEATPVLEADPSDGHSERAPTAAAARQPNRKESNDHMQNGQQFFKAGQLPEALSEFLIAADSDPTYAAPMYLAARCYTRLGKGQLAVETLRNMKALNSEEARQLMYKAARDGEFKGLRALASFKDLTGTAVIQLLNGAGEPGLKKIAEYKKRLDEVGMPVAAVGNDRSPRHNTYIYAKAGFENQGEDIRRQLRLGLIHKRQIDWPSEYDIIVVHGEPVVAKFEDDEAEKGIKKDDSKDKEAAAKAAKDAADAKSKADMKKKLEMIKMLQEMEAPTAPTAPDPTDPSVVDTKAPEVPAVP